MGCHTWFYKKIDDLSEEFLRQKLIKSIENEIDFLSQLKTDRDSFDKELLDAYPEWTSEYVDEKLPYWNDLKNKVSYEMTYNDMADLYCEMGISGLGDLTDYVPNKGWYSSTRELPHDLFRKYGYPDDKLFSLEESLNYIRNPDNQCCLGENTEEWLREFWLKYPDGMILFG